MLLHGYAIIASAAYSHHFFWLCLNDIVIMPDESHSTLLVLCGLL